MLYYLVVYYIASGRPSGHTKLGAPKGLVYSILCYNMLYYVMLCDVMLCITLVCHGIVL